MKKNELEKLVLKEINDLLILDGRFPIAVVTDNIKYNLLYSSLDFAELRCNLAAELKSRGYNITDDGIGDFFTTHNAGDDTVQALIDFIAQELEIED